MIPNDSQISMKRKHQKQKSKKCSSTTSIESLYLFSLTSDQAKSSMDTITKDSNSIITKSKGISISQYNQANPAHFPTRLKSHTHKLSLNLKFQTNSLSTSKSSKLPDLPQSRTSKRNQKLQKTWSISSKPTKNSTKSDPSMSFQNGKNTKRLQNKFSEILSQKKRKTKILGKTKVKFSSLSTPEMAPLRKNLTKSLHSKS